VPKSTRVICHTCGARLGAIRNDRLTVDGHRVDIGPRGAVVITCATCKTARIWETRRSA
jgi:RNase P subunit RPR2